jgi:hypothetical protein
MTKKCKIALIAPGQEGGIQLGKVQQGGDDYTCRLFVDPSSDGAVRYPAVSLRDVRVTRVSVLPQCKVSFEVSDVCVTAAASIQRICDAIVSRIYAQRSSLFHRDNIPKDSDILQHYFKRPIAFDDATGTHKLTCCAKYSNEECGPLLEHMRQSRGRVHLVLTLQSVIFRVRMLTLEWRVHALRPSKRVIAPASPQRVDVSPPPPDWSDHVPSAHDVCEKTQCVRADAGLLRQTLLDISRDLESACDAGLSEGLRTLMQCRERIRNSC